MRSTAPAGRAWPLAAYQIVVEVATAPEAMTPLMKRLRVSFGFTIYIRLRNVDRNSDFELLNLNENCSLKIILLVGKLAQLRVNHLLLFIKQVKPSKRMYFGLCSGSRDSLAEKARLWIYKVNQVSSFEEMMLPWDAIVTNRAIGFPPLCLHASPPSSLR